MTVTPDRRPQIADHHHGERHAVVIGAIRVSGGRMHAIGFGIDSGPQLGSANRDNVFRSIFGLRRRIRRERRLPPFWRVR